MGVHTDGGFGVLNMTNFKITCGLSMGATHYYENDVLPGQIFYRWPGAVWYTVYCLPTTDSTRMTDGKCAKEIITVSASAIGAGAAAVASLFAGGAFLPAAWSLAALTTVGGATGLALSLGVGAAFAGASTYYGTKEAFESALQSAFEKSHLYAEKKGCYGGGSGTWLVLQGGPRISKSVIEPRDFTLTAHDRAYVFDRGVLTGGSYDKYHTGRGLPEAVNRMGIDYEQPL